MDQESDNGAGSFEPTPIGDILRSETREAPQEPAGRPEPAEAAPPAEQKGETEAERARDERGRFAPKEAAGEQPAAEAAPPAAEQKPPQSVPLAAVLEERKKRQELEAKLRELEARIAQPAPAAQPAVPAQPEVPLSDLMFQDPDRFVEVLRAPLEEQLVATRVVMSERIARQAPDFEPAMAAFDAFVQANPEVLPEVKKVLRTNADPAGWALEKGRQLLAEQQWAAVRQRYGSPEAYEAAMRAHQQPASPEPAPASSGPAAPPASLASVRSAGPRSGAAPWRGHTPLSAILGRR